MLSASALRTSADATHDVLGGPGRWLLALPTTHIAGLQVLVRSLRSGLEPAVADSATGFTASSFAEAVGALDVVASEHPHYTALVPTQLQRLLDDGAGVEALWQLDAVLVGGAAASPALLARAADAGVTVVRTYGMTETCGGCVYDGVPLPEVDVTVADDGRVRIAGPVLFDGYLGADASELDDGWFTTSDLGTLDGGVLRVHGRVDNVIVSGGVKVPAEEVERVVLDLDGVTAAVVVGVPDAEWGERVVAVVRATSGIDLETVRDAGRDALPREWLPRLVLAVESLPMLPSGKPDRAAVRLMAADLAR
jgi:O-succinylbenzoic acid--CoA ligase